MNYQNIKSDLAKLYCVTKNKQIEDVFLRYAQEVNSDFVSWLKSTNLMSLSLGSQTMSGLNLLIRLREKFPSGVSFATLAPHFVDNPSDANGFSVAKTFCDIKNDPRCSEILSYFSDILSAIRPMSLLDKDKKPVSGSSDAESLAKDLSKITEEFHSRQSTNEMYEDVGEKIHQAKESKKEKTEKLFAFLLHEFTKEISSALIQIGQTEKARVIQNWAIANPVEIIHNFSPNKKASAMGDDAVYMVKTILKSINEQSPEEQFNFIRNRAMLHAKILTEQEYKNYYLSKIKNMDVSKFTGSPSKEPTADRLQFNASKISNPDSIVFISLVLYGIYEKVK